MNFSFSDDQILLKNSVRAALDEQCKPAHVRAMFDDSKGYSDRSLGRDGQAGLARPALPRGAGRRGPGPGRARARASRRWGARPTRAPSSRPSCSAAWASCSAAAPRRRTSGSPRSPPGKARATAALLEEHLDWDPAAITATAAKTGERLDALGPQALRALGARGRRRPRARALARGALALPRGSQGPRASRSRPWSASISAAAGPRCGSTRSRSGADAMLGQAGAAGPVVEALLRRAAVMSSAEMLGAARRCLDMSVEYAKVREQFGQPIGSFQAIRHRCAEMLLEVENAHAAVYYAAWALTAGAEDAAVAVVHLQGLRQRSGAQGLRRRHPGARRHRLHLGVRPAPLHEAGQGAGAAVRGRGVPPRADRRVT